MKPKLLSDVLRQISPRKMYGNAAIPPNRFSILPRDASPADSVRSDISSRSRSQSIKRKNEDSHTVPVPVTSYANVTSGNDSGNPSVNQAHGQLDEDIATVRSLCDKLY
jgi:hypothetical protein